MKHLFTFCLLLLSAATLHAQVPVMYVVENFENSDWVGHTRTTNTLNTDGTVATSLQESYTSNAWINMSRTDNTYDANDNLSTIVRLNWDQGAQDWVNVRRTLSAYDGNSVETSIDQVWTSGAWQDESQTSFTYDTGSGNKLSELRQVMDGGDLVNDHLTEFVYDANDNPTTITSSSWNTALSAWDPESRHLYVYTSSGKVGEEYEQIYENNAWNDFYRLINTYDTGDVLSYAISGYWSAGLNGWVDPARYEYTWNPDGTLQEQVVKNFDDQLSFWLNDYRIRFVYEGQLGMADLVQEAAVFPNPATDQLNIAFAGETETVLEITDLSGKTLIRATGFGVLQSVSINELPAGTYLLNISSGGQTATHRVIKS